MAHFLTNRDRNGFRLGAKNKLRPPRVEKVQLVRATAHAGVVLLHEIPAHLIFGDSVLLISGRSIRGRRRLRLLEIGGVIHSSLGVGIRVGVRVLRRVIAVHRSLGGVGHGGSNDFCFVLFGRCEKGRTGQGYMDSRKKAF